VNWDGPDDPENPRNWRPSAKWSLTVLVSFYTLVPAIASSMVAPAMSYVATDINDNASVDLHMIMTIFVLAFAIGPFALAPLSEFYGRAVVLQAANTFFCIFNLLCGFARTKEQLMVFRFFAGLGGSGPLVIGGGVLADLFSDNQRGIAMSMFTLVVLLGPCIGPLAAGFMVQAISWRWTFFAVSIMDAVIQGIGAFALSETYAPVLLGRRAKLLRNATGNQRLRAPGTIAGPLVARLWTIVARPFLLLFTQPIVFILAIYLTFVYGLSYLVIASFPALWRERYSETAGIGGLNYISVGLGFALGTGVAALFLDRTYVALSKSRGKPAGTGRPEFRIPLMVPASVVLPIGLVIYGWSAEHATHWVWPNLGAMLLSSGISLSFQVITVYVVDCYQLYAASALASITFIRSLAGFGFPLFATSLYDALGYGWGNTLLALVAVVIGVPAPFVFWTHGEKIRARTTMSSARPSDAGSDSTEVVVLPSDDNVDISDIRVDIDEPTGQPAVNRATTTTPPAVDDDGKAALGIEEDKLVVAWDGPEDPENPRNWKASAKWTMMVIVSLYTLVSPIASSMVAPALSSVAVDIKDYVIIDLDIIMTIFILAYAIGPFLLAPLSEFYGRVPVLQVSNAIFCVFNLLCGFAQNKEQLMAFRFLAGLGGSGPLVIGGGVLTDLFVAKERGLAMAMFTLVVVLGPCVGPIAAGFMAQTISWRWIFYVVSIFDAIIQVAGAVWLRETYEPVLLERRAKVVRKQTGNDRVHVAGTGHASLMSKLWTNIERPFLLLFTQPIVLVMAIYMTYLYGLMYIVIATFPDIWTYTYGESIGIGGVNYVSIGLGFILGTATIGALIDRIYVSLSKSRGGARPEFRIPLMVPGSILLPVGLVIYGWTADRAVHWFWPNFGILLFSAGLNIDFQCITIYVVDSYQLYSASALAAITFLRSVAGFGFPLFAENLYDTLHYGWGNTLLALVAVVIGIPSPFIFWAYGERLRSKSKFAAN
ncbi:hypothetical protein HK405_005758, partial [Cladochytrium tenue]